ncbi:hypothetical protein [Pseudoalteromonas sp. Of7M-16]|uniref:hypothetical protein n=1 Tax=Pseudoalteromonas sp. Of7M-16 TaxID=2917756 RepID=UPI001EF69766|nr:hypothetical protein [Pseudoalteromonas sp. Of7M-16]MCG7547490.1 hypothetical protein [Pseudoalteromonas sp. Of7M-16]
MKTELIVEGLENFYDLWSCGVSGNALEVARKISEIEICDLQLAKKIIKEPVHLRIELGLDMALDEKHYFERTGLKCKLVHVGPDLLNQYSASETEKFIIDAVGCIQNANIRETKKGTFSLFSNDELVEVEYEEDNFFLYLASLRYLALKNKVGSITKR